MIQRILYLLGLILVCSINFVNADWEEVKNIRFTDCVSSVDELDECKKLAKTIHAQFFYSSEMDNECNICYNFRDSNPETSWPYKAFVYIPNNPDESGSELLVNMKSELKIKQHINYIVRIVIKSEISHEAFARFYCLPDSSSGKYLDMGFYLTDTTASCQLKGLFTKNSAEINFEYKVFNGNVQFHMNFRNLETDGTLQRLILEALYVVDSKPSIPGSSIMNLIEKMKEHFKIKEIRLLDKSNVKFLSLYVYGTTYYQSHQYQYTSYKYKTQCVNIYYQQELFSNIRDTKINLKKLRTCISGTTVVSRGITVRFDNFMDTFDIVSASLVPQFDREVIRIQDLYTLNTQVLKKIELPDHTLDNYKMRECKRSFPEILSTCIYDQIREHLKKEQINCINAIKKCDHMLYVDAKIKTDLDKNLLR